MPTDFSKISFGTGDIGMTLDTSRKTEDEFVQVHLNMSSQKKRFRQSSHCRRDSGSVIR